jgi:cell fate (sporulation/competence/biofilm development) regulator YlbF (YheA/YmcA/DUF963 family)
MAGAHSPGRIRPAALCAGGLTAEDSVIDEKAQDLGRLIGQTEEYKALKRASERLREDADCQRLLADMEKLAGTIEAAARNGKEPTPEQAEQYDKAVQSIQVNQVYQQMAVAQANFEKLMAKVNARIYEGIQKGAASPIITLG